jgi:membrane carboxypeptidase/penicillin-binding protein
VVGGRDLQDSPYDRIFDARRQPGSAFQPFVYLAALSQGIPPTERLQDAPIEIALGGGQVWRPRNYTGTYDGELTLREALTRSKNTVTVRLAQQVGVEAIAQQASALGITTDIPRVPATALGAAEVRPSELVAAYAAFANGGTRVVPHLVRRVEDGEGNVLWEAEQGGERVLDAATAFVLTTMLRDVVDRGTGTPVRQAGFHAPAAGKTGTTNRATDVWFVGYTPDLVASVWFGFDQPQEIVRGASGGTIAAPVWGRLMTRIYAHRRAPGGWSQPHGVFTEQVYRLTGYAVDPQCPSQGPIYTEYFVGSRPARPLCVNYDSLYLYPPMDTTWRDEEYSTIPYDVDTVGMGDLRSRGIESSTLEQQRRSGQAPREFEVRVVPPPPPPDEPLRRRGSRSMEGDPGRVDPEPQPRVLGTPATGDTASRDTSPA